MRAFFFLVFFDLRYHPRLCEVPATRHRAGRRGTDRTPEEAELDAALRPRLGASATGSAPAPRPVVVLEAERRPLPKEAVLLD
jgi:hypothetical protein